MGSEIPELKKEQNVTGAIFLKISKIFPKLIKVTALQSQ